jgi:hypothetical protein
MAMGEPWGCAAPTNRRGGCRCDLFQPSSLSHALARLSPFACVAQLCCCCDRPALCRSLFRRRGDSPRPCRYSGSRAALSRSGLPKLFAVAATLCVLLSAFRFRGAGLPFAVPIGWSSPAVLCVLSGGCRRLCCSVLLSAVVVWLASSCWSGEGSGAVFVRSWRWSPVREEFVAS